jgi:hypothetical protein
MLQTGCSSIFSHKVLKRFTPMCISLASTFDTSINEEVINHTAFSSLYEDEVLIAFFPLANFFAQSEFFISIWSLTIWNSLDKDKRKIRLARKNSQVENRLNKSPFSWFLRIVLPNCIARTIFSLSWDDLFVD